jgi:hypothetical protein
MKYTYSIKELNMNGYKKMYFSLDEGLKSISVFLNSDISSENTANLFIEKIKKVQNGEIKSPYTFGGNTCSLKIMPDIIYVQESYMDNGPVSIEPGELISLIESYIIEKKKYKERTLG